MPDVRFSLGPMLIGVFLNMILYGVLLVQAYSYYRTYKGDKPWIKYLVLYLFVIETINTILDGYIMYEPLILRFGTLEATTYFPTLLPSEPLVILAVSTPIQLFFAWRIKMLTKKYWISAFIVFLVVLSLTGGIWTAVKWVKIRLIVRKPELHYPALLWFLSSSVADVVITIALVINLSKRRTGYVATDDAISKIIRMTVQTGMLTAFFAIADVIFFMTIGRTSVNLIWDLALSKLYSNCLLSTLNARASLNELTHGGFGWRVSAEDGAAGQQASEGIPEFSHQVYELDRSFNAASARPRVDGEYGITVTKAVERLEDPKPTMRETTQ